jgi:hypothetical protein
MKILVKSFSLTFNLALKLHEIETKVKRIVLSSGRIEENHPLPEIIGGKTKEPPRFPEAAVI